MENQDLKQNPKQDIKRESKQDFKQIPSIFRVAYGTGGFIIADVLGTPHLVIPRGETLPHDRNEALWAPVDALRAQLREHIVPVVDLHGNTGDGVPMPIIQKQLYKELTCIISDES